MEERALLLRSPSRLPDGSQTSASDGKSHAHLSARTAGESKLTNCTMDERVEVLAALV